MRANESRAGPREVRVFHVRDVDFRVVGIKRASKRGGVWCREKNKDESDQANGRASCKVAEKLTNYGWVRETKDYTLVYMRDI